MVWICDEKLICVDEIFGFALTPLRPSLPHVSSAEQIHVVALDAVLDVLEPAGHVDLAAVAAHVIGDLGQDVAGPTRTIRLGHVCWKKQGCCCVHDRTKGLTISVFFI